MRKGAFLIALIMMSICRLSYAQSLKENIYNPKANAAADIQQAVAKAKATHKNVFLEIGGNWCIWCRRFNYFVNHNDTLSAYLNQNFEVVHINYSKENKNKKVLAGLSFPQRFGFPVFVILNAEGKEIHVQNSAYLEEGKGYAAEKILDFLKHWSPAAIDPKSYQD